MKMDMNLRNFYLPENIDLYVKDVTKIMEVAAGQYRPDKVLIWRETSAQRGMGIGGEYNGGYSSDLGMSLDEYERAKNESRCIDKFVFDDTMERGNCTKCCKTCRICHYRDGRRGHLFQAIQRLPNTILVTLLRIF